MGSFSVKVIDFKGTEIAIDRPKGTVRPMASGDMFTYPVDYGFFPGTQGGDGEELDVFVGPNESSDKVFVLYKMKWSNPKLFDELKVFVGFNSYAEAFKVFHPYEEKMKTIIPKHDEMTWEAFKAKYLHHD